MPVTLRYGETAGLSLDLSGESLIADWTAPRGEPLDDTAAAVAAAVSEPLGFPPLVQATAPGDRICLAVPPGVPQADAVVAGIVHELLRGYAQPEEICIVHAPDSRPPLDLLPDAVRGRVEAQAHDPGHAEGLCYLAASAEGAPIYMNRRLVEADVVIPIGVLRDPESLGYFGIASSLFPEFADQATKDTFRAPSSSESDVLRGRRRREAEEAAWLLGVQFSLQVIPGASDSVLHILAGDSAAVEREGERLCKAAWGFESPRRAQLVVAAIEGGPEQQTWENFARALHAARQVATDDAAIVLCTEISCRPGPALQRLSASRDLDRTLQEIRRDRTNDALSAALLAEVQQHANVYLLSGLNANTVEDLGMAFVETPEEIGRLASRVESCILLGSAHRTAPHAP